MKHPDQIFKTIATARANSETFVACLYTGEQLPRACAPMPRDPEPVIGLLLESLLDTLEAVMGENPSVHDGAIMVGRLDPSSAYRITGWSYRLFPRAHPGIAVVNRGSAFHSCLAMSYVERVDAAYLVSHGRVYRFQDGVVTDV
ncbi:MAG TPA: hypothetical protein VF601_15185 [Beijerinckiaceae bacterium]|jgi:hypothetical protein